MTPSRTSLAEPANEAEVRSRLRWLPSLVRHAGAYVIVCAVLGLVDLTVGEPGLQWAQWVAGAWGFVLAFHVLAVPLDTYEVDREGVLDEVGGGWDHREWPR